MARVLHSVALMSSNITTQLPPVLGERREDPNVHPATLSGLKDAGTGARAEIAVGWLPRQSRCRAHVFIDGALVGGASASGGRLHIELPRGAYAPGRLFTIAMRFFTGDWRCQIWLRVFDDNGAPELTRKLHEARDQDPSNPNDDTIVWSTELP